MKELKLINPDEKSEDRPLQLILLEAPVVSDLDIFVDKSLQIADRYPEILERIVADQVKLGIERKKFASPTRSISKD